MRVLVPGGFHMSVKSAVPGDDSTVCIVMYGGGLTSYEAARRAIERYGHNRVEIWFADTRMEDDDLYRFNRDVEKILEHKIIVFDQGVDVWGIFYRERFLGNSRIDPCSKFLKRVPLRKELENRFPNSACVICRNDWSKTDNQIIKVQDLDGSTISEGICENCLENDKQYSNSVSKLIQIIETEGNNSSAARNKLASVSGRIERCDEDGNFVRVVLGMDNIEDCDRMHRAKAYWRPFVNWFPLAEPPFKNKTRIIEDIRKLGVQEPRLYAAGFAHNNCGGFCVKAGVGQMVHLWKTLPERYLEHEQKELEFQEFIGSDVTILTETRNGEKRNLSLQELRKRAEQGEEFRFNKGTACACLNPASPEADGIAW